MAGHHPGDDRGGGAVNVYIVCRGERGEGHSPVAAFTTFPVARRWAEARYGPLARLIDDGPGHWMWDMGNGVDEVAISRQAVKRSAS